MTLQSAALTGLAKTNLRQQALSALRQAITTGELPPGTHLVETELSEKLQVSRTTLREAMRQLQQEGLVAAGSRGLSVRSLTTEEIFDIFAVRAALESLAARLLAQRDDRTSVVATLRRAVREMEKALESPGQERIEADLSFHRTLCQLSGNEALLHAWKAQEGSIRMFIMWAGMDRAIGNMRIDRHDAIVDVIATGTPEKAAGFVFTHLIEAATNLTS